jgi:hypothetical protein
MLENLVETLTSLLSKLNDTGVEMDESISVGSETDAEEVSGSIYSAAVVAAKVAAAAVSATTVSAASVVSGRCGSCCRISDGSCSSGNCIIYTATIITRCI